MDLRAVGVPLAVEVAGCNKSLALAEIRRVWARCLRDDGEAPVGTIRAVLDDDPELVADELAGGAVAYTELAHLLHDLSPRVTDLALRLRAHHPVALLHAGGVCDEEGNTVVVVGPSGAGKTTAVRRLTRHFGYVSDETIAVATDLTIAPYPKPFSVLDRGDAWKTQHAPDELDAGPTPATARAAAILVLDRQPGAGSDVLVEELDTLEAMSLLVPQVAFLAGRPGPLGRLAMILDQVGPVRRVRYEEADDLRPLVSTLLDLARDRETRTLPATDDRLPFLPRPSVNSDPSPSAWRLGGLTDLHHLPDGRAAVLVDDQFLALSPAAGAVLRALEAAPQGLTLKSFAAAGVDLSDEVAIDLLRQLAAVAIVMPPVDAHFRA